MKRILFAWEMGANFGHVNKISQVARELEGAFDLSIAARNVVAVRDLAPDLAIRLLPAPFSPTRATYANEQAGLSYSGVLRQEGWDKSETLVTLIEAWRAIFQLVKPDALVVQAAPTALLAARGLGLKTVLLGSGYDAPPRAVPMPNFLPDDSQATNAAVSQEQETLDIANVALEHYRETPLKTFRELLDVDEYLLMAYPESDHYAPRDKIEKGHPPYLGQLLSIDSGVVMEWHKGNRPKIMAYLRPNTPQYDAGIAALATIGSQADIILAAPGIDPTQSEKLVSRGVRVCDGPVRLDHILPDCDLGISHGTNGIGSAFIAKGVPQIALPTHREQMMFSQTVARAGIGLGIAGQYGGPQVLEAIQKALASKKMKSRTTEVVKSLSVNKLDTPARLAAERIRALSL